MAIPVVCTSISMVQSARDKSIEENFSARCKNVIFMKSIFIENTMLILKSKLSLKMYNTWIRLYTCYWKMDCFDWKGESKLKCTTNVAKKKMINLGVPPNLAQWIFLCLPSCRPGFEFQAHHLCFLSLIVFVLYLSCDKNEYKQKSPGLAHFKEEMINCIQVNWKWEFQLPKVSDRLLRFWKYRFR